MRITILISFFTLLGFNLFAQKREVVVQSGHPGRVEEIAFSSDGKILASGDNKGIVKLWDLNTRKEIRTIQNRVAVNALDFAVDDKVLLVSGDDRSIRSYNLEDGTSTLMIENSSEKFNWRGAALNGKKMFGAQLTEAGNIEVFDLKSKAKIVSHDSPEINETDFRTRFEKIKFSPDGNLLARATPENIILLDLQAKKHYLSLKCIDSNILQFDFEGQKLAAVEKSPSTGKNQTIKIFTVKNGLVGNLLRVEDGEVFSLAFSKDGTKLAGIVKLDARENEDSGRYSIRLWELAANKIVSEKEYKNDIKVETITQLKFSPDEKYLGIAGDGQIDLFDTGLQVKITELKGRSSPIEKFKLTNDGGIFAKASGGNLLVWDLINGKQKINRLIADYDISSDGQKLISYNTLLRTYEIEELKTGKPIAKLNGAEFGIMSNSIIFSSKDRYVLALCPDYLGLCSSNDKIKLFDPVTGNLLFTFPDSSSKAVFSSDESLLAYVSSEKEKTAIKIWDIEKKREIAIIPLRESIYPIIALNFSKSGKFLAFSNYVLSKQKIEGFLEVYEIKTKQRKSFSVETSIADVIFTLDETALIATFGEKIKILNISDGKEINVLSAHNDSVESLSFSPDGKYLVSGGNDGQIFFWNFQTKEILLRLILIGESDFLFVSPDNYYLASRRGAASAIAFREGLQAFPFEQFDIKFNRPDFAFKTFGTVSPQQIEIYKKAYKKRLSQNGLTELDMTADLSVPKIELETRKLPILTKEKKIRFKFTAEDNQYLLERLNVYVNDIPIYGEKGVSLNAYKTKFFSKDVELELVEGNNRIQVTAFNEKGFESVRQTFNIKYEGVSPKPELYIIAIGVSSYKDNNYDLTYPAKNAETILNVFEQRVAAEEKSKSFYRVHRLKLTDKDVTVEKIGGISDFLRNAKSEDEVVFFISGHGLLDDEKNYYFATYDIDFNKPSARGLSFDRLEELIDRTAARRKIVLLDSCHAGELDKSELETLKTAVPETEGVVKGIDIKARSIGIQLRRKNTESVDETARELFADLRLGSGAIIISASGGLQYAYESQMWLGGVFTYSIRRGLEEMNADKDDDDMISISELRDFTEKEVFELTRGRQKPNTRRESLEYDFRVY